MRSPAEKQIQKRRAVARALNRQAVLVSSRLFQGDGTSVARVFVDGELYDVHDRLLGLLMDGRTPAELGIEPVEDLDSELR